MSFACCVVCFAFYGGRTGPGNHGATFSEAEKFFGACLCDFGSNYGPVVSERKSLSRVRKSVQCVCLHEIEPDAIAFCLIGY